MNRTIDVHVHLAALPEGDNGCYISPEMKRGILFRYFAWSQALDLTDPASANTNYLKRLVQQLDRSKKVGRAVILGMDGVYDKNGDLDLRRTHFLISNRYVFQVVRRYPNYFLPGVSINPQRSDALDELERCVEQGAALVKFLPNSQGFDPSDRRYIPFYQTLAKHRTPLLSHVGYEFSLMGQDQTAGDPNRLRIALDEGVCVIAAHACSYGLVLPEPYFKVLVELAKAYQNFYADTSALTLPNRVRTLFLLRHHPELYDRLIFGTDYPLHVFAFPAVGRGYTEVFRQKNTFDRLALVLNALGIKYKDLSALIGPI